MGLKTEAYCDRVIEHQASYGEMTVCSNPEGWGVVPFGEVVTFHKGVTYKSEDYCEKGNGIIFFNLKCVSKNGGFNREGIKYYNGPVQNDNFILPGDIVIANTDLTRDGDIIGCPVEIPEYYKDKTVCISMDLTKIVPNEKLNKRFCYYFLQLPYCRKFMKSHSSGSTVLHLNLKSVKKLLLDLPPLHEQRKIAAILSSVDAAIEQTDAIIAQTEQMKKGLMQELFTKGIGHTEFKETKIGRIPGDWTVVTGTEIFSLGGGNSPKECIFGGEENTLFIKVDDLNNPNNRSSIKDAKLKLDKSKNPKINIYPPGTIVFPKRGAAILINRVSLLESDAAIDPNLMALCVNQRLNKTYFKYYLLYFGLFNLIDNSGVPQINNKHLYPLNYPLPSLSEQQKIATVLSTLDEKLEFERMHGYHLRKIKHSLMQDLLIGRIRVKVDGHA